MASEYTPVIILPGIGQSRVRVVDENGAVVRDAWPISADPEKLIGPLKGPLMKMVLFRRDAGFSDAAAKVIGSFADDLTVYPDGTSKYPLKVDRWDFPVSEYDGDQKRYLNKMVPVGEIAKRIGEENIFFFAYNSFGDAFKTADELDSYIQNVKSRTGADRVDLMAVSLGGVVALAYFEKYGTKKEIRRFLNVVSAVGGTHLLSDILDADFDLSDPHRLIHELGKNTEDTFSDIIDMLPAGVAEAVLEKCAAALADRIAVNSTIMWGAVPRDKYIFLKQKYLLDGSHDRIAADADKIHRIHTDIKGFAARLEADGVEIYNICAYGEKLFPLCASHEYMSDDMIDSESSSMGAVFAAPGEELPDSYIQVNSDIENAVSPDRVVDASAGAVPDRTWFFAGQKHNDVAYNDVILRLAAAVLASDEPLTVNSDPAFPRFNGSRNLRKIVSELYPRFAEVDYESLSDEKKRRYRDLEAKYKEFSEKTALEDNEDVSELEKDFEVFLALLDV